MPKHVVRDSSDEKVIEYWLEGADGEIDVMAQSPNGPMILCSISDSGLYRHKYVDKGLGLPLDSSERVKEVE